MPTSKLLLVDAIVNLVLGLLLILFPRQLVHFLGVPVAAEPFYPNILGAVLFGIGIALWLGRKGNPTGLGLGGAIAINLSGASVLAYWLLAGDLQIPTRGHLFLWVLVLLLVGISAFELVAHRNRK